MIPGVVAASRRTPEPTPPDQRSGTTWTGLEASLLATRLDWLVVLGTPHRERFDPPALLDLLGETCDWLVGFQLERRTYTDTTSLTELLASDCDWAMSTLSIDQTGTNGYTYQQQVLSRLPAWFADTRLQPLASVDYRARIVAAEADWYAPMGEQETHQDAHVYHDRIIAADPAWYTTMARQESA